MQKTLILVATFSAVLLLREKQNKSFVLTKEAFCFDKRTLLFLQRFLQMSFLENKEKTSNKNTEKCSPIHL